MNKLDLMLVIVSILCLIFVGYTAYEKNNLEQANLRNESIWYNASFTNGFSVMAFNLQIFGKTKASNDTLLTRYADIINDYTIVFASEIRDESGEAVDKLCNHPLLINYTCYLSSRAGLSTSKEQYLLIYKKASNIKLMDTKDYNLMANNVYAYSAQRPPLRAMFTIDGQGYAFYTMHTSPDNVGLDLSLLQDIYNDQKEYDPENIGKVIILGDLNADCDYYNEDNKSHFGTLNWIIPDTADTTTGASDCAYDRIIANDAANQQVIASGVRVEGVDSSLSDHYPVYVRLAT